MDKIDTYTLEEKLIVLNKIFFNEVRFKEYYDEYKIQRKLTDDKVKHINTYFRLEYIRYLHEIRRESNKNLELFRGYFFKS